MIYLIDDNQNNHRENLGIDFIEEGAFADILTSIGKIEKRPLGDLSHLDFLKNAECILLHYSTEDYDFEKESFISGSRTNVVKIIESISEEGDRVPLVLFSNGMGDAVFQKGEDIRFVREINKNTFYSRLFDFIEYYKESGKIEIRILIWGKNFRYKEVSDVANILLETFTYLNGTDCFEVSLLEGREKELKQLIEMTSVEHSTDDILNNLKIHPVTINELRSRIHIITESVLKYGKNIYPWK